MSGAAIVGSGIDVQPIARVAGLVRQHARELSRIFTRTEQACCERATRGRDGRYAAAFAAKEAVLKAIGTGWTAGIEWSDIDTSAAIDWGVVALSGGAERAAAAAHVARVFVSTTRTRTVAAAAAVAIAVAVAVAVEDGHV